MSPQSPNSSSTSTDQEGQGKNPAAAFGPNEWLVDEIYQQYLQDPNSVDRAWWDFFADYKPGAGASTPAAASEGSPAAPASGTPQAAPAAPSAPAAPAAQQPAPKAAAPAAQQPAAPRRRPPRPPRSSPPPR
ncbi:multifunctional oxoglutarate decarboxylase/oxoglutarate dehydrogenase thiamine pyrophosphate-binding subunit/dihydrolipoyllysine-residue succinyltransferase subunit, partial [Streptomyces chrestomyceticus]